MVILSQSIPSSLPPSGAASGDLSNNYPNPTVVKIEGNPVSNAILGANQDGYVLTWVNADGQIEAKPITAGSVTLAGDVSGAASSNTVVKVHGATIPVAGSTGNTLQVTGSNALGYAAVNLAGGANFVTGVLPAGNQANQTLSGDVTGNTGASVVSSLQGNAVQSGALGSNQDGYVLAWTNGSSQWQARPASSTVVSGQDYSFSNVASDISNYNQLNDTATGSQQTLTAASSNSSKQLIKAFATLPSNPNVDLIPAGLWEFNFYAFASLTGAFTTTIVFDVYSRTSGGSETLIFTATSGNIQVTSSQLYTLLFNQTTDTVIAPSSRLVIKVSAVSSNVVSTTVSFVFDGSTNASLVRTPISGSALQLGGDLSGTTTTSVVNQISGTGSNAFTSSGTNVNIIATETVIASGTTAPVFSVVGLVTTTDASTVQTIASWTPPVNTTSDISVTLIANDSTTPGQFYRADLLFTVSRASGAPVLSPSSPAAANVRSSVLTPTVAVSLATNLVKITVTGSSTDTVHWSCNMAVSQVS